MSSVLIHIGAHKTGTTAIQSCFDANRRTLARENVIYPRCNWYHHAQHRLAFAMRGQRDPGAGDKPEMSYEIDAINRAIKSASDEAQVFISSEEFFAASADSIAALRDGLDCTDIRILAVLRRPDELFVSMYNQNVKTPQNNFQKKISAFLENPTRLHRDLSMRECVENWADAFGEERVLLRRYEDASPLSTALSALGLPHDLITVPRQVNQSVPAAVAEVMRISKVTGIPPDLRKDLYRVADQVFAETSRMQLPEKERRALLTYFEEDLESLFRRFGMKNSYRPESVDADRTNDKPMAPIFLLSRIIEALLRERR